MSNWKIDWIVRAAGEKALWRISAAEGQEEEYFLSEYSSPFYENSLYKGIPNTPQNIERIRNMWRRMKKNGHWKGKRLTFKWRGGVYNHWGDCDRKTARTFAVYVHDRRD